MNATLFSLLFLITTLLAIFWALSERDARIERERAEEERRERRRQRRSRQMASERDTGTGGFGWVLTAVIFLLVTFAFVSTH